VCINKKNAIKIALNYVEEELSGYLPGERMHDFLTARKYDLMYLQSKIEVEGYFKPECQCGRIDNVPYNGEWMDGVRNTVRAGWGFTDNTWLCPLCYLVASGSSIRGINL
jgi:hypothetical protein